MNLFESEIMEALFLSRPNRFLVDCMTEDGKIRAYMPNPGKLYELLIPGRKLFLTAGAAGGKYPFTVVGAEKDGIVVPLHTHRANDAARWLVDEGKPPFFRGWHTAAREVTIGKSRLDFLLEKGDERLFLEVKSCSQFDGSVAMFPDAVTERGVRHMRELDSLARGPVGAAVLFLVASPYVRWFFPDYHTDILFARTMLECRPTVQFRAAALHWNRDFSLNLPVEEPRIPWEILRKEMDSPLCYLQVLRQNEDGAYFLYAGFRKPGSAAFRRAGFSPVKHFSLRLPSQDFEALRLELQAHFGAGDGEFCFCGANPLEEEWLPRRISRVKMGRLAEKYGLSS